MMVYVVWGGSIRTCGLRGNGGNGLELPECSKSSESSGSSEALALGPS
jgi:hypothetical protein